MCFVSQPTPRPSIAPTVRTAKPAKDARGPDEEDGGGGAVVEDVKNGAEEGVTIENADHSICETTWTQKTLCFDDHHPDDYEPIVFDAPEQYTKDNCRCACEIKQQNTAVPGCCAMNPITSDGGDSTPWCRWVPHRTTRRNGGPVHYSSLCKPAEGADTGSWPAGVDPQSCVPTTAPTEAAPTFAPTAAARPGISETSQEAGGGGGEEVETGAEEEGEVGGGEDGGDCAWHADMAQQDGCANDDNCEWPFHTPWGLTCPEKKENAAVSWTFPVFCINIFVLCQQDGKT